MILKCSWALDALAVGYDCGHFLPPLLQPAKFSLERGCEGVPWAIPVSIAPISLALRGVAASAEQQGEQLVPSMSW